MDDVAIKNFADLSGYIGSKRPGDKISITFVRGGITKTIPLTLKNRFGKETVSKTDYVDYYIGETKVLSDTDKSKFNIDFGVKIIKLKNKELLAKGLQNNDIILAINDVKIYSVNELSIYLKNNENKDYVTLQILNHQGRIGYVSIRLD